MTETPVNRAQLTHLRRAAFSDHTLCGVAITAAMMVQTVGSTLPVVRYCGQCVSRFHRIHDHPVRFGGREAC